MLDYAIFTKRVADGWELTIEIETKEVFSGWFDNYTEAINKALYLIAEESRARGIDYA